MKGDIGDTALYFDSDGESHQAIITGESMNDNADLTFTEDDSWGMGTIGVAVNTPHRDGEHDGRNVYELKPSGDWDQELL